MSRSDAFQAAYRQVRAVRTAVSILQDLRSVRTLTPGIRATPSPPLFPPVSLSPPPPPDRRVPLFKGRGLTPSEHFHWGNGGWVSQLAP